MSSPYKSGWCAHPITRTEVHERCTITYSNVSCVCMCHVPHDHEFVEVTYRGRNKKDPNVTVRECKLCKWPAPEEKEAS